MTTAVRFDSVSKNFGEVRAVDAVDLEVSDGEFFSMLGPSGSGKTTCLRLIAGFDDRPARGLHRHLVAVHDPAGRGGRLPNPPLLSGSLGRSGGAAPCHVPAGVGFVGGGMLAFALSFDEVIVTTFTAGNQSTLPIWIFSSLARPRQRPVTNVVAMFVVAATFIPIVVAARLTQQTSE